MKQFINWLVVSSANPDNVALTVKGSLIAIIPTLILVASFFHLNWSTDSLMQMIQAISAFVAGLLIVVGLIRKIYFLLFPSTSPQ